MRTLRSGTPRARGLAGAIILSVALLAGAIAAPPAGAADPEPFNVALASGDNAPTTEVNYVPGWNSAAALNNGVSAPTNTLSAMWGTWGAPGNPTQDWAVYTWEEPVTVSSSRLFLWQNRFTGDAGVMIPAAWKLEYRTAAGEWTPVSGANLTYPLPVLDTAAPVGSQPVVRADFTPVTTTAVRLTLDRVTFESQRKATSVVEWEVWGVNAPAVEPEPEDPNAFIDSEAVAVRTTVGDAPLLPERVWVIGENGPLTYVAVEWADVTATSYAAPGEFTVTGDPAGYDGQSVSATVHVGDDLSDVIEDVDYSVSITTPGVEPVLPDTVVVRYDDGTASSAVEVEWEDIPASAYAEVDSVFDVDGTVTGFAPGAVATVFVVEPVVQDAPIVTVEFDSEPQGSGWYTTAPTATISAEATASPVAAIEYSLNGGTWTAYTQPFVVPAQGEVTLTARATSEDEAVGESSRTIKVDSIAPVTAVDYVVVGGSTATVTLSPTDAEPGSGVTRTVWSDGPDESPTGETNNMFATYEAPFSVQLTAQPRFVHVQTQDAAGNVEQHVTITLPALVEEDALDLVPTVATRCVAGKVALAVSVKNADDVPADITVSTAFGSKSYAGVRPGATASVVFTSRMTSIEADTVATSGSAGESTFEEDTPYAAKSCG